MLGKPDEVAQGQGMVARRAWPKRAGELAHKVEVARVGLDRCLGEWLKERQ